MVIGRTAAHVKSVEIEGGIMSRRRYLYAAIFFIILGFLLCWTAILIDERCARNEAEREAVSVEKLTKSMNSYRLSKED